MGIEWFEPRTYRHFDAVVGIGFAQKVTDPDFVARHSWLPLIRYVKRTKRYKKKENKTTFKDRNIMYPSQRDACILSKYASEISCRLDSLYEKERLSKNIIAYRRLGKSNYHFSADAYRFAQSINPCVVLCFDIIGFFDNLDHAILKNRLKNILGVGELPGDWYAVFRHVTKYSYVDRSSVVGNPLLPGSSGAKSTAPIATIKEIINAGIPIKTNENKFGIPQGTPISASLSNLYMLEVDKQMVRACQRFGALYQRYSDDILIICHPDKESKLIYELHLAVAAHKLKIKDEKTERAIFGPASDDIFQYLGFNMSRKATTIRPSSLARQWRKAKHSISVTKKHGDEAIAAGRADKIFTKRLRKRFQPVGARNFSKYARRSADVFGSDQIKRQVLRFERMVDQAIRDLVK